MEFDQVSYRSHGTGNHSHWIVLWFIARASLNISFSQTKIILWMEGINLLAKSDHKTYFVYRNLKNIPVQRSNDIWCWKKQAFIASEYITYLMNSGCCSQLMYRKLHVLACSTLGYYFTKDSFLKTILLSKKRRLKYFMIRSTYDRWLYSITTEK